MCIIREAFKSRPTEEHAFRQLALQPQTFRNLAEDAWRRAFDRLHQAGYASHRVIHDGRGVKYDKHVYTITEKGRKLYAKWLASLKDAKALVPDADVKKALKNHRTRSRRRSTALQYRIPTPAETAHRSLIEAQSPLATISDGNVSSRDLTKWYVEEFCRLNNLKLAT